MRILVHGFGAYLGGIVRVHNATCRELQRYGDVTVSCAPRGQTDRNRLIVVSDQSESRLRSMIQDVKVALQFPTFDLRVDSAPALRPFTRSRSHIVIVHDLNFLRPAVHKLSTATILYRQLLHQWTLRRVDRIVVNSAHTLDELLAYMPGAKSKSQVLPLPVSHIAEIAEQSASRRLKDETISLLTFGHARNKGVEHLLRVLSENNRFRLTVICPPRLWQDYWHTLAQSLQVEDRVEVIHGLSDSELVKAYKSSDVFCMASSYEGYGLPVAEAIALEVPCVITPLSILQETSRGYAITAVSTSSYDLTMAIDEALATPKSHWRSGSGEIRSWTWTEWVNALVKGL